MANLFNNNNLLRKLLAFFALGGLALGSAGANRRRLARQSLRRLGGGWTCEDVWNVPAKGPGGTYTCGARITWLEEHKGMSRHDAKCKVASEIPAICGLCCEDTPSPTPETCNPTWSGPVDGGFDECMELVDVGDIYLSECQNWCATTAGCKAIDYSEGIGNDRCCLSSCRSTDKGCKTRNNGERVMYNASCTGVGKKTTVGSVRRLARQSLRRRASQTCDDVWNTPATGPGGTYTCGARITWLEGHEGMSKHDAMCKVASEIPTVCGVCCESGPAPPPSPTPSGGNGFSVVTMNLYWWNLFQKHNGGNFFKVFNQYGPYDIMFFQEVENVNRVVSGLGLSSTYGQYGVPRPISNNPVALAWNKQRFQLLEKGYRNVAEDQRSQYYGKRGVAWARLRDIRSNRTFWVGSHHGPLPVNSGGQDGGKGTADNIARLIIDTRQGQEPVILGGDFNADSNSSTISALVEWGLTDQADDWVDHILTQGLGTGSKTLVRGTGSDHNGIKLSFPDA